MFPLALWVLYLGVMALEDVLFCWLFQEFCSTQITRPITYAFGG
jgi:hypothetical protein